QFFAAYDSDHYFSRDAYFTLSYDILPSKLDFTFPMKMKKENMDLILDILDLSKWSMKPLTQSWKIERMKTVDDQADFVYKYLFQSETRHLLLYIDLSGEELEVAFLYDLEDKDIEKWIYQVMVQLRQKFGKEQSPTFKVLSVSNGGFHTEQVNTGNFAEVNINRHYNDDFQEVHQLVTHSLENPVSGLILLHGEPGTGKTSYIKHLISKYPDTSFIFIQNEFVESLLKPDFVSFLLRNKDSVLVIEDAEKVIVSREHAQENSVVSTILQLTDGLFSDYLNIKILCTFNTGIEKIDKALLRKGRMIARYEFKELSEAKTTLLANKLGHDIRNQSLTLADIYRLKEKSFQVNGRPSRIGFKA
ncbi:MAG: AAA family ATPase, partial [Bacteroidota bacterium]